MQAARTTPAFRPVPYESDSEEEGSQLTLRRRTRREDPGIQAKAQHLKVPPQGSQPPQRAAPPIPAAAKPAPPPSPLASKAGASAAPPGDA
jgi:hypothetical protein